MTAPRNPAQTMDTFLAEVRAFMRDFEGSNRLLQGEEHSPRAIMWAIANVLDSFANTPPPLGFFSVDQIPRYILLPGVVARLLQSSAIKNLRDSLNYVDGQIRVDLDKWQALMALSQMFKAEYDRERDKWKVSLNISRPLATPSGLHSEYYVLAGLYGNSAGT